MRRPSRVMPALPKRPVGALGWVLAAALLAGWGWAVAQHAAVVLPLSAAVGCAAYVSGLIERRRLQSLASVRQGESICTFTRTLPWREVDPWVVRAVYEQLQAELAPAGASFPLRPSDHLYRDLRFDPDDIDMEIVADIANRCNRDLSKLSDNPFYGQVSTVADLVAFMCAQPEGRGPTTRCS